MKMLTNYLKKRKKAINNIVAMPKRLYTPATFHKLRVEIKKLNAFFDLLKFCVKDFKQKKTFKPFKLIFIHAGKVRALQVEEAMLKKHFRGNVLQGYRHSLKKLQLKEQKDYFAVVNKKLASEFKKKYRKIVFFAALLDEKKTRNYMEEQKNKIEKLVNQETLQPLQLHGLRTQLKNYNYNRSSLNLEHENTELPNKDVLPHLLGNWHDCQIAIKHLTKSMNAPGLNQEELIQSEKIKISISLASQELFDNINTAIHTSDFSK